MFSGSQQVVLYNNNDNHLCNESHYVDFSFAVCTAVKGEVFEVHFRVVAVDFGRLRSEQIQRGRTRHCVWFDGP